MSGTYTASKDIKGGVKKYLQDNLENVSVYISAIPPKVNDRAVQVSRIGSAGIEDFNPLDNAVIQLVCREASGKKADDLYNAVRDLLNRKGGYTVEDAKGTQIYIMRSIENSGPIEAWEEESGLPLRIGRFLFVVRED